jgi:hypothetical protein
MPRDDAAIPELPASCLAAFVARGDRSPETILRRYKFREAGEGRARIICHPPVITLIRRFYKLSKDVSVLDSTTAEWRKKAGLTDKKSVRSRLLSNAKYIDALRVYLTSGDFKILRVRKISCQVGQLVFKASPDLWVREKGEERLIRVGFGQQPRSYVDTLLIVTGRAATMNGYRILPRNVAYLQASTGRELLSRFTYEEMILTLTAAAREIAETWPRVTQKGRRSSPGRAASAGR